MPTFLFQLLTSLTTILINNQAGRLTGEFGKAYVDSLIAGMGAELRVVSMGTLMVFGFIKGLQPIAGFSYGAKKFERVRDAVKTSILWSTGFCLVFGVLAAVFSKSILSAFTSSDEIMVELGGKALCKRPNLHPVRLFNCVFLSLPCPRQRERGLLARCVSAGHLLYPRRPDFARRPRCEWHPLRPTCRRCCVCDYCVIYGAAPEKGTARGRKQLF